MKQSKMNWYESQSQLAGERQISGQSGFNVAPVDFQWEIISAWLT